MAGKIKGCETKFFAGYAVGHSKAVAMEKTPSPP
jgi:hypothetical protein